MTNKQLKVIKPLSGYYNMPYPCTYTMGPIRDALKRKSMFDSFDPPISMLSSVFSDIPVVIKRMYNLTDLISLLKMRRYPVLPPIADGRRWDPYMPAVILLSEIEGEPIPLSNNDSLPESHEKTL